MSTNATRRCVLAGGLLALAVAAVWQLVEAGDDEPRAATASATTSTGQVASGPLEAMAGAAIEVASVETAVEAHAERSVRLRGVVSMNGRPLPDARLPLTPADGSAAPGGASPEIACDASGRFELSLAPGEWLVEADPRCPTPAALTATVPGPWTGELGASRLVLVVTPERREDGWYVWEEHGILPVLVCDEESVHVELLAPLEVRGRVVVDPDDRPAAGVLVRAGSRWSPREDWSTSRTDGGGAFAIRVPATRELFHDGLVLAEPAEPDLGGALAELNAAAPGSPLLLRLRPGLSIEGRVLDADARPVSGATAYAGLDDPDAGRLEDAFVATTDVDGRFHLRGIPGGLGGVGPRCAEVYVTVEAPGFHPSYATLLLPSAGPLEVVLTRPMPFACRIRGPDGRSLPLARVDIAAEIDGLDVERNGVGSRDGERVVVADAPERAVLLVTCPGHLPRLFEVRLPLDGDAVIDLEASPPPLVVRVATPSGEPVANALVDARPRPWSAAAPSSTFTLRTPGLRPLGDEHDHPWHEMNLPSWGEGPLLLPDVPADVWLEVHSGSARVTRHVAPGTREVEVVVPMIVPQSWLSLRVLGESGPLDLGGVTASVRTDAASRPTPLTVAFSSQDATGASLRVPGSGPARLVLSAPGHAPASIAVSLPAPGGDLGTITLTRGGTIDVRLHWPDRPLWAVELRWTDPSGAEMVAETEPPVRDQQPWVIGGVTPGHVLLTPTLLSVDDEAHELPPVRVVVRAGETTRADLDLRAP